MMEQMYQTAKCISKLLWINGILTWQILNLKTC